jgi:sulfonate transport system substrate-binding protein
LSRYAYGVRPISDQVVAEQQKIADTFYELKLIPKPISIKEAVWNQGRAKVAQENPK